MHVYLHVPFCARRCSYCDFSIAVRRATPSREFVAAVLAEWRFKRAAWQHHGEVTTLYFGGGTPSRLDAAAIPELIGTIGGEAGLNSAAEITLEANPDDITSEKAAAWAAAGVNRISLGMQSHDPQVLAWMHRTHSVQQVPVALSTLRDAGIDNISVDLIFGLPVKQNRDWERDLDLTFALQPDHISLYGLTIEPHTPLSRWVDRGTAVAIPDTRYAEEYLTAHDALVEHGFEHYEVSNAALPGRQSRHNSAYWQEVDYLGLGPSAHSLRSGVRSWNTEAWAAYQRTISAGGEAGAGSEILDSAALELERRYLGLRTRHGLPEGEIPAETREQWVAAGWGVIENARLSLTAEGWLRMDALVASLRDSYLSSQ